MRRAGACSLFLSHIARGVEEGERGRVNSGIAITANVCGEHLTPCGKEAKDFLSMSGI